MIEDVFSALYYRRGYERFPLSGQAEISTELAPRLSSLVADISSRGASIVTTVPFEKNDHIDLLLKPCSLLSRQVRRQARVVWCSKIQENAWQVGLDFGVDHLISFS